MQLMSALCCVNSKSLPRFCLPAVFDPLFTEPSSQQALDGLPVGPLSSLFSSVSESNLLFACELTIFGSLCLVGSGAQMLHNELRCFFIAGYL